MTFPFVSCGVKPKEGARRSQHQQSVARITELAKSVTRVRGLRVILANHRREILGINTGLMAM